MLKCESDQTTETTDGEMDDDGISDLELVASYTTPDTNISHPTKKRRIHMGVEQCEEHSQTEHGAKALTNPAVVKTSSKDPNRGLYPRFPRPPKDPTMNGGFVSAKTVMDGPSLSQFMPESPQKSGYYASQNTYQGRGDRSRRAKLPAQSNKLSNYFTVTVSPSKQNRYTAQGGAGFSQPPLPSAPPGCDNNHPCSASQGAAGLSASHPILPSTPPRGNHNHHLSLSQGAAGLSASHPILLSTPPRGDNNCPLSSSQGPTTPPNTDNWPKRKSSPLYSPLKRVSENSNMYILDTSCQSEKSQSTPRVWPSYLPSLPEMPPQISSQKSVVKTLFDTQKTIKSTTASRLSKKSNKKPKPKFNRNNQFLYSKDMPVPSTSRSVVGDKYGLLGQGGGGAQREEMINYFDSLPMEVTENILCRLPLMDLLLNVNRVCGQWKDIISGARVRSKF